MTGKERLRRAIVIWTVICTSGLVLAFVLDKTGVFLPCPFREATGFLCPGCGITRMFIALMNMDFKKAFHYNMAVFILLPVIGVLLINMTVKYVRYGTMKGGKIQNRILMLIIIFLIVFGIIRNLV